MHQGCEEEPQRGYATMRASAQIFAASVACNAILFASLVFLCIRGTRTNTDLGVGVVGNVATHGAFAPAPVVTRDMKKLRPSANLKEIRGRIESVKNTKKITSSMKLVAAAKVRKAQAAVLGGRPFAENLVKTLYGVNQKVRSEDLDSPLTQIRPVKNVLLVSVSGDRGLCGAYNTYILKKVLARTEELEGMGIGVKHLSVGNKMTQWLAKRKDKYDVMGGTAMDQILNPKKGEEEMADALSGFAEEILSAFTDGEVDKVEIVYTKFKSLIGSDPVIQTLLPLTPKGEICDVNGVCIDADEDEIFKLTTAGGDLKIETEKETIDTSSTNFEGFMFEQPPNEIVDAILPLYMDSTILRSLQESVASELAARMNAMSAACDNADELKTKLNLVYNRGRQAKITNEILEIVAGANAVG
uniref:F-ATPase gamma subunit n=1 Tax=Lotharella oceanica TaxID=641309 RepID=A0A7S2TGI8_9EUKA